MNVIKPPLKALGNMVIVQPFEENDISRSNIIIPEIAKLKNIEGVVVSVGDGIVLSNGKKIPLDINIGEVVIYDYKSADPIKINGIKYLFIPYEALLAVNK